MQFSDQGREAIKRISDLMKEIDSTLSMLSNEERAACQDFHSGSGSINHCVRWGVPAAGDVARELGVDVGPEATVSYQGAKALEVFWLCVGSFVQPDATGSIQELVRDEKYDLMLREIPDVQGDLGEQAIRSALERAEMIVIDSGNIHGDAWMATFYPKQGHLLLTDERWLQEQSHVAAQPSERGA